MKLSSTTQKYNRVCFICNYTTLTVTLEIVVADPGFPGRGEFVEKTYYLARFLPKTT